MPNDSKSSLYSNALEKVEAEALKQNRLKGIVHKHYLQREIQNLSEEKKKSQELRMQSGAHEKEETKAFLWLGICTGVITLLYTLSHSSYEKVLILESVVIGIVAVGFMIAKLRGP